MLWAERAAFMSAMRASKVLVDMWGILLAFVHDETGVEESEVEDDMLDDDEDNGDDDNNDNENDD